MRNNITHCVGKNSSVGKCLFSYFYFSES